MSTQTQDAVSWIATNIRERHFTVDSNFKSWRLDVFLAQRLGRMSRDRANEIVKHGDITLRPKRKIKPSLKLRVGDVVIVREHLDAEHVQDAEVSVLFEDEALIILNKPAGMLVHETARVRLNTVQLFLERSGLGGEAVHRLDKDTSGILVCTKRHELVPKLRHMFATSHPQKTYRALVLDPTTEHTEEIWPVGSTRTIDVPLGPITSDLLTLRMGHGTQHSRTHVHVLNAQKHLWGMLKDLEVRIETGRQHQIRVHLWMQGTPIAGDKLYGKSDTFFTSICDRPQDPELLAQLAFPRHALHAWRIAFTHPESKKTLKFEAPLPKLLWNTPT